MARSCIFCGGTKLTREHIWPNWAAGLTADAGPLQHRSYGHTAGSEPVERTYEQMPYHQKARIVCESCNTGWMSQTENAAKPYFMTMLYSGGRQIHGPAQRTLSTWALKTCAVFVESQAKEHSVIPREDREYLREHGEPPPNVYVLMVSYDGSRPASGDSYGIEATTTADGKRRSIWGGRTSRSDPSRFTSSGQTCPSS